MRKGGGARGVIEGIGRGIEKGIEKKRGWGGVGWGVEGSQRVNVCSTLSPVVLLLHEWEWEYGMTET